MENSVKKDGALLRVAKYLIPWKGDKPAEIIRKIIFLAAAIALVVTLSVIIAGAVQNAQTQKDDNSRAQAFHSAESNVSDKTILVENSSSSTTTTSSDSSVPEEKPIRPLQPKFESLLEQNPDTIGWIYIPDMPYLELDYPVMQTDNNDYYLTHDFDRNEVRSGALFVDYHEKITPQDQPANIIIYGHNMATQQYFAQLTMYCNYGFTVNDHSDISFYRQHPTVQFDTLYSHSTYKIFAAMMVNTLEEAGEVFPYHHKLNFESKADFNEYVAEILDRSLFYNPDVDVTYGDQLLTLSTCLIGSYETDMRFVIFARETREGESETVDVSKAYYNPNPKFYDLYYKQRNYTWEGRKWDKKLLVGYEG